MLIISNSVSQAQNQWNVVVFVFVSIIACDVVEHRDPIVVL